MILSDFSYKIVEYDNIFDFFCAEFADYGKKQYLCRKKTMQGRGACCPDDCMFGYVSLITIDMYERLSREYYFYPFC